MKDYKKMMKSEEEQDSSMDDVKTDLKKEALRNLSKEMSKVSGGSLMDKLNPKASVTVATDDPSKLPDALAKAKDLAENMPEMGESGEMDEEDCDIEDMTPEQMKAKLKALMGK